MDRDLSGTSGMWACGAVLGLVFVASTLPTSLYDFYQAELRFSEITLTLIYSAYVLGTLAALLFVGRLSDQIGRRPTALAGMVLAAASMVFFFIRVATPLLYAARFSSGLAVGLAAGACTAWIAELNPRQELMQSTSVAVIANLAGLGLGPLLSGLCAQLAPWPLRLVYILFFVSLLPAMFVLSRVHETVGEKSAISLRPRIGVPQEIRDRFVSPTLTGFGIFALGGFYAALTPGMLRGPLRQTNRVAIGAVVLEFFLVGAVGVALTPRMRSRASMLVGLALLVPSLVLLVAAGLVRSLPLLVFATAVGGACLALGYRGSLQIVNQIAPKERRAEVLSAYLLFCYLGVSLPVIGVGIVSQLVRPSIANVAFAVTIGIFAAFAWFTGRKDREEDAPSARATV